MRWFGCASVLLSLAVLFSACGQKKIEGPFPETGELSLRAIYLVDPALPALSDEDLRKVLDASAHRMSEKMGRQVRFGEARREDLQTAFDRWIKPFGKVNFSPRLDTSRPLTEEDKRILYARILDLLRSGRIRPLFPLFSMDPSFSQVPDILDKVMAGFESALASVKKSGHLKETLRDRQSVFAWFTILGTFEASSKPADLILTNDMLIFDSISTFPAQAFASGGVTTGYSRVYPGVTVVSTLPILAEGEWADMIRGPATAERRHDILAWAIASELGGRMIEMNQDEIDHAGCLSRILVRPYAQTLDEIERAPACAREHHPLNRRQLLGSYLAGLVRSASTPPATRSLALDRLRDIDPAHPLVVERQ